MKVSEISRKINIHHSTVSNILAGRRRPSWPMAKRLAAATGTNPVLWVEGKASEIRKHLEAA